MNEGITVADCAMPSARAFVPVPGFEHGDKRNVLHREVAHLDGNRANAVADNLRWVSHIENHSHRKAHGTHPSGENHPRAKLRQRDVDHIRTRYALGLQIAADYSISRRTVYDIWSGRRWPVAKPSIAIARGAA